MKESSLEVYIALRKIARRIHLESKRIDKEFGLSLPQYLCLYQLYKSQGFKSSYKDIMDTLSLNSSTVTGIIKRLIKKGLIYKSPHEDDKRRNVLILSAGGLRLIETSESVQANTLSKNLEKLDPEERQRITSAMDTLIDCFSEEDLSL